MLIKRPRDCNVVYNENHENGFLPLPVRREEGTSPCGVFSVICNVSAWEPDPIEMARLRAGGVIEVSLMIPQMCGIMLSVTDPVEPLETPGLTELVEDIQHKLSTLEMFYRRVLDEQTASSVDGSPKDIDVYQAAMESHDFIMSTMKAMRTLA